MTLVSDYETDTEAEISDESSDSERDAEAKSENEPSVSETDTEDEPPTEPTVSESALEDEPSGETTVSGNELEDELPEETTVSGNELGDELADEATVSGNELEDVLSDETTVSGNELEDELLGEAPVSENAVDEALQDETSGTGNASDGASSGNESAGETTGDADTKSNAPQPAKMSSDIELSLSGYYEYDELRPGETAYLTATVTANDYDTDVSNYNIIWKSSDTKVAVVARNEEYSYGSSYGNYTKKEQVIITAKDTEGIARITAECEGVTAAISIMVRNENAVKIQSRSKDYDDYYYDDNIIRVIGFQQESADFVYSGQKITQNFRVYHNDTLLKEKTDYTLTYKNNVNAAAYDSAKAPSVTIKLKGQYKGSVTLYYTIKPINLKDINIYGTADAAEPAPLYGQAVTYAKNLKLPTPELSFNGKKLAVNKDFICDYTTPSAADGGLPEEYKKGDSYTPGTVYTYTVKGTGNFEGSIRMNLVLVKDKSKNFNTAKATLNQKQYVYSGKPLTKSEVTISALKLGGQSLGAAQYDYVVSTDTEAGPYVLIYPTEAGKSSGYYGSLKVSLKLAGDRNMKEAVKGANWKDSITFSEEVLSTEGGFYQSGEDILRFGSEVLTEGKDYTVKYRNEKKAGTATVTFTGMGRYKGSLSQKYTIAPNTDKSNLQITWQNVKYENGTAKVPYQKGGADPGIVIKDKDNNVLKLKTDYTVKLKDNKTPGQNMSCVITGKGNYKGYTETLSLPVTYGDISLAVLTAPDKAYSAKADAWKAKVTLKDKNGKALSAGKDYDKEVKYVSNGASTPAAGDTVTVTVKGIGCYEGSEAVGTYRIYKTDISKLSVRIADKEYTGEAVELDIWEDIHVYGSSADRKKGENEIYGACEIAGYTNNIKSGTAKVILRGIGDYGGTKAYSFKINKKEYLVGRITKVTLDKTAFTMNLSADETDRMITATINPGADDIDNATIVWTSSNSKIADVKEVSRNEENDGYVTVSAVITAYKEGSVTITATAQDGGKKAKCKVSIVDMPVFKQAGETFKGEAGSTIDGLELLSNAQNISSSSVKWSSSNEDMVSVETDGTPLKAKLNLKKQGAAVISVEYKGYVQECYVLVIGEDPNAPKEEGDDRKIKVYKQPEGTTDDTAGINKILQNWTKQGKNYDYLYIPDGVYHIDTLARAGVDGKWVGGINIEDNQTLVMSPSALIMAIPNGEEHYHVIYAFGRDNIRISGGQIVGDRYEHTGKKGEWGHGIDITGSTNVTIENVNVSNCWGDGIYLGQYTPPGKDMLQCDGVTIKNCVLHHNRRSNMSITHAKNVTIDNCEFNYANGTDPQFGIDIEPNEGESCSNVTITDSTFKGNKKASMGIMTKASNITLENCKGDGEFLNDRGKDVTLKNCSFKKVTDNNGGIKK